MSNKIKRGPHNLFVSYVEGEVEFRKKHFKNVEDLYKYKESWKCSMCSCSLENSILKGAFCKHPALGVLVCNKCLEYYGDGLFSPDEEGEDKFCRWCAQGGELYCCSNCVCTFCKKCVYRHFKDNKKVLKSLDEENWQCFLCVSKPIWFLRALCWAVYHFKNEFVKIPNDGDGSRSSRHRSNKRSRSSSSEEEESSVSKRNESQRKLGPHSKTRREPVQSASSSDEDFKRKPERPKRIRNGRNDSEDKKTSRSRKHKSSDEEDESRREKEVRNKTVGPKSRTLRSKISKENSDSSEDEEDKEEKRKHGPGPKSKVENTSRTRKREEKKNSSRKEESMKSEPGPKSKADNSSRKNESSEDESSDESSRRRKPGPKSRAKTVSVESENEEEGVSSDEKPKKTKIGPKSKTAKPSKSSAKKPNILESDQDENKEAESGSSDEKNSKKPQIGSKSEVSKESERSSRRKNRQNEKEEDKVDRKTREEKKKENSDEEEKEDVRHSRKKTREDRNGKKQTNENERDLEKSTNGISAIQDYENSVKGKVKTSSIQDDENSVKGKVKTSSQRVVQKFKTVLELRENLAMEIKMKTEKQKKLANENKFSSARNSHKIFNLLNEEMKEYSRLFLNLSALVEDNIEGLDAMFELDNQILDTIYDEATLCTSKDNSKEENNIKKEIDENLATTGKTKKKRKSDENIEETDEVMETVEENVEDSRNSDENDADENVDISAILSTDDEQVHDTTNTDKQTDTNASKNKSKNKTKKETDGNEKEDKSMDEDEKENVKNSGISLILTSDEDLADNKETDKSESDNKSEKTKNKKDSKNKSGSKKNDTANKSDSKKIKANDVKSILSSDSEGGKQEVDGMEVDDTELGTPAMSSTMKPVGIEDILTSDDQMSVNEIEAAKASVLGSEDEDTSVKKNTRSKSRTPSKDSSTKGTSSSKSKSKSSPKEKSGNAKPATIDSILTSDSDDNEKENKDKDPEENEATSLNHILSSSEEEKIAPADVSENQESKYYSMKSDPETETNEKDKSRKNDSKRKEKRKSSCKEESQSEKETKETSSGTEDDDKKGKKSEKESKEKKKRKSSISNSVAMLTGLSSLEKSSSSKSDTTNKSKTKKKEDSDKSTTQSKKKGDKDKSLLEFLNEEDTSSAAEELEESTELLSSLIKAKSEEAKKQNEEMIKQALLRADDESNKDENSSEVESDVVVSDDDNKKDIAKKIKKEEKKSKKKSKDSSSDSDGNSKKKKKGDGWRNDPLLKGKLSDTDTSDGEKKFEAKLKKEGKEAAITLSSDEELFAKKKAAKKESSGDDSDCFVIKKKKMNKRRGRLRDSSDSSDVLVISSSEVSSSSDEDFKKKKKDTKKKRSRIKKMEDSDESGSGSDVEELNASQGTPGKGRKNIRHILTNEELAAKTINASKAEEERKKRIEERQARYNKLFKPPADPHEKLTKLVLDFDEKTSTELISVHPELVCKLKPHQVEGVRFMFNACFESVHQIKKNKKGSGCILAHCMGLGKTLQVVTLVHTLMTHQDKTKVERVMVVTPLNTVANWVDEFHNWLKKINNGDDVETFNLIKAKKDYERSYTLNCWFEEGGVLIIGYEMFRNLINKRGLSKKVKTIIQKTLLDPGPDLVVCDEGHILKNEASAVSKAMCQIRSLRRIILTGTPLQNNLEEYHCMVQFIKPNLLGDRKEFKNRFANPINNGQYIDSTPRDVKIMKRRAHVLYKMLDGIVQRKDYNVLTPFLPPKYEYVISIKLTDLQIKLYSHYLQTNVSPEDSKPRLFADYQTLKLVWTHPYALKSASLSRQRRQDAKEDATDSEGSLRDFIDDDDDEEEKEKSSESGGSGSNSPPPAKKTKTRAATRAAKERGEVVSEEEKEEDKEPTFWWTSLVTEEHIQDIRNSNKLLAFMFVLKQCEEIGDKLLVFSQSLETLSLLEYFLNKIDECSQDGTLDPNLSQFQASWTLGLDYFRLDGSSSSEDRSYWVKSFNNPSNLRARLFLISTKAGGLGINLVSANRVIIFDVSWNPSHDIQSIFRVFRFGQTKPSYIYRFLAQGTMEEKIYDRQVAKQSMSCRVVDEQQIDRHFTRSDITELYEFKPDEKKDRKIPALPKDRLMAEMIKEMGEKIVCFHEHDSLLENVEDEELNEDERKAAWEEFESEKTRPAMSAGANYVNNLIMQNNIRQQQAGMMGGVGGAANLKLDSQQMLNFLKNSNPDVSEEALVKIVDQNAQRLEDYKKRQESQFNSMINNMHQTMTNAALRGMPVPGVFPRLPNQIGMGPRGPIMGTNSMGLGSRGPIMVGNQMGMRPRGPILARPLRGAIPGAVPGMPGTVRPTILKSNARTVTPANVKRMGPASSRGGVRPPIPLPPGGPDAPGNSSSTPIEI